MNAQTEETFNFLGEEEHEEIFNIGLYIGSRNINGQRDGRGWAILPNGDQYDGQYRKGRRHGIGLYVFANGARYYGQYRCGRRSGRGIFIYPDGSVYEGMWRKNLKHGKGRYNFANGDTFCGSWYKNLRHGVGVHIQGANEQTSSCGVLRFRGTWHNGIRVGPFELAFGVEEKTTCLHGTWDNYFPQGPAVFNFDNHFLLMGYFETPGRWGQHNKRQTDGVTSSTLAENIEEYETEEKENDQDVWADEPSLWYAQEICLYDYALLPQEPLPLPLSDSDLSVCSLSTKSVEQEEEKYQPIIGEFEEGELEHEAYICEHECSTSEIESSSEICVPKTDPCAIEIINQPKC